LRLQLGSEQVSSLLPISQVTLYPHVYFVMTQNGALWNNFRRQKQREIAVGVGETGEGRLPTDVR